MTIRLHVERLSVEGMPLTGVERSRLERAVINELTRLLGGSDAAQSIVQRGAVASLASQDIRIHSPESGTSVGEQIAQSVYGSLVTGEFADGTQAHRREGSRGATQ